MSTLSGGREGRQLWAIGSIDLRTYNVWTSVDRPKLKLVIFKCLVLAGSKSWAVDSTTGGSAIASCRTPTAPFFDTCIGLSGGLHGPADGVPTPFAFGTAVEPLVRILSCPARGV